LFLLGLKRRKKQCSIRNPFLFEDFKLGRYILANLESEVHEACWIDFCCLNAMFWMSWHVNDCFNTLCLYLSLIWNLPNILARLMFFFFFYMFLGFWVLFGSSEGLGRHFESKLHKYVSYFRLIVLELRILCIFMMICYFY
jgi:hypothetical protein